MPTCSASGSSVVFITSLPHTMPVWCDALGIRGISCLIVAPAPGLPMDVRVYGCTDDVRVYRSPWPKSWWLVVVTTNPAQAPTVAQQSEAVPIKQVLEYPGSPEP